ncbi:MAG: ABC transporter substrate-binding protein [Spirochaetaceae bacterium]|nr:ABC transporter substrate-binding protein [Spirochaetaceae bacterium]
MKKVTLFLSAILIISALFISIIYFRTPKAVKMGFIADLTGRQSQLGISVRNGFLMAIDEINADGGINGREIIPILKNNENDLEVCLRETKKLIDEEADVIIGPLTSAMVVPVLEASGDTPVISPTVSTDRVTGIDDMFFRVIPAASMQGKALAEAVIKNNEQKVVIILDERNIEYTGAFADGFKEKYEGATGIKLQIISFSDKSQLIGISHSLIEINPDALVFVSSGVDAAGIIQQYAKIADLPQLYSSYWGKASNVHEYGGSTVENMILIAGFENPIKKEKEIEFQENYRARYKIDANFAAQYSYETVLLYATAAQNGKSTNPQTVKSEILKLEFFEGITDNYSLNEYGDVIREQTLFIIRNNEYDYY